MAVGEVGAKNGGGAGRVHATVPVLVRTAMALRPKGRSNKMTFNTGAEFAIGGSRTGQ